MYLSHSKIQVEEYTYVNRYYSNNGKMIFRKNIDYKKVEEDTKEIKNS